MPRKKKSARVIAGYKKKERIKQWSLSEIQDVLRNLASYLVDGEIVKCTWKDDTITVYKRLKRTGSLDTFSSSFKIGTRAPDQEKEIVDSEKDPASEI